MLTLLDIQDKKNPIIIATYLRDKQFSVAICTTADERYVFITNPQGIITLPLKSQVFIHTEVSIINLDQLTGYQSISKYQMQEGNQNYIFQVGQLVQFNFVILYPQNEDQRIIQVSQYLNGQIVSLPFYMHYDYNTQTLIIEINKSALGNVREGRNQNMLLIKTVIPLQISQFQYTLQDQNDVVTTDQTQADLILSFLIEQNYLDSKQTITDFFDSSKPFKFNNDFLIKFAKLQSSNTIQNVTLFIQQLEHKVLQTLILSYYINPVIYFVEPSLSLSFTDDKNYVQSLSKQMISVYLEVDKKIGKFVNMNYPGVITSFSQNGDQIKLEGSLNNINSVLQKQIIFANKTQINQDMYIVTKLSDDYNYPYLVNLQIQECPFIILKEQIKVQNQLQNQVEKLYTDSIVDIQSQISLRFAENSFTVSDIQQISYKLQLFDQVTSSYQDITPEFWLQSQGDSRLNYYGTIPSKYFNYVFKFKIIANDSYTVAEDQFILKAYGISFYFLLNVLAQVLGPLIAIFSIYKRRCFIWNILYKNQTQFEDEYAFVGEQYNKQIILMGNIQKDSIQIVDKLLIKLNEDQKVKQNTFNISKEIVSIVAYETQFQDNNSNNQNLINHSNAFDQVKNFQTFFNRIPRSFIDKVIKKLTLIVNHKPNSLIEKLYLNKCGSVSMQPVIHDILNYKLTNLISQSYKSDQEVIKQLQDVNSRIHIAIKSNIARRLLLLDKKSQQIYDFIKECAIKYYQKKNNIWYKAFIEISSSANQKSTESLQIFSSLRIKIEEIKNLFVIFEIIPQKALLEVNNFSSLLESLHNCKAGINMYLIRDCLYADAYGLNISLPSRFYLAQGESIHLNNHKIKQIQAFSKHNVQQIFQKYCFMLNLGYKQYAAYKNIRLPTWINLKYQNGVIKLQGTPTVQDVEDILIRIYDQTGYIVKSFIIKVTDISQEKQCIDEIVQEEEILNSLTQSINLSNQKVLYRSLTSNKKSNFHQSQKDIMFGSLRDFNQYQHFKNFNQKL